MNGRKCCEGCIYYRRIIGIEKGCNLCIDTGIVRGTPVEKCPYKDMDESHLKAEEEDFDGNAEDL